MDRTRLFLYIFLLLLFFYRFLLVLPFAQLVPEGAGGRPVDDIISNHCLGVLRKGIEVINELVCLVHLTWSEKRW